jgi:mono/diheme cytochrome c family protein/glucose/arabinose dehydrogenase
MSSDRDNSAIGQTPQETNIDSLSYRISRSVNDYPVIHIPLAVNSNSKVWKGINLAPYPPVQPLSVKNEQKHFVLQPGYHLKAVLTGPKIMDPVAVKFDGDGRMYVVEERSFMRDIRGHGEAAPICRISRWEDTNNDGVYDHGTVFIDSLVFPRFILPFGPNTVLTMQSNQSNIYKYIDTNGDGKADKKMLFTTGMGRAGNIEHQTSFLTWAMDNWMYSTYNSVRIRWTPKGVIKEKTGNPKGQWGVTQDNYGKTWYQGGNSGVPDYFQFPIEYGSFHVKNEFAEGFRIPYSLIDLGDVHNGMAELKPDGTLARMTSGAGCVIYRGDRLPKELVGDYFYGGPVARIIRRIKATKKEGLTYLSNYYQPEKSEFIQSTDPLFRPIDIENAPDGTMYIVDMYRGVIEEHAWIPRGSYLGAKIKQYQLDKVIGRGRIWRLTYKGMGRDTTRPHMYEESSLELVQHLKNPSGWWRSKAQQLLVLRQDKSIVPALRKMIVTSNYQQARFHALWTLEGLESLKVALVLKLMNDSNPHMRIQAIRASETLYKKGIGVKSLTKKYRNLTADPNTNVDIQAMITLNVLGAAHIKSAIKSAEAANSARGVHVVGDQILSKLEKQRNLANRLTPEQLKLYGKGATIYTNLCSSCHGDKGFGAPANKSGSATIAPALSGSKQVQEHREFVVKTLLHGLSGLINGKTYAEGTMPSMGSHSDKWVASIVSYIRNSMGNKASFVTPAYVAKIRKATDGRKTPYTYKELITSTPHVLKPQNNWSVTASNSSAARGVGKIASAPDPSAAFKHRGWQTKTNQKPGIWFQVDMKKLVSLTKIRFDSPPNMFPRKYIVQTSMDGHRWETVAEGQGKGRHTIIDFNAVGARYVRIKETSKADAPWSMHLFKLYIRK